MPEYRQWGGRFAAGPDEAMLRFSESLSYDRRLYRYDIRGSQAHVRMLAKQGILTQDEASALRHGLDRVLDKFDKGGIPEDISLEDIHTAVEASLKEFCGDLAGKVHTGRSRNDQVALDMHLWCIDAARDLKHDVRRLQEALLDQAEAHPHAVMPGYTHLQRAQPVLLAHHLLAYFFMLERDAKRLDAAAESASVSPLGAAALAGSTFPLDPSYTASLLGLKSVYDNSMDAVSDRDYLIEFCSACATLMAHLSRLAEEIVLWTTPEFGFAVLPDSLSTGSSIMPQKKNPDPAELIRGRAGRVFGSLAALLTVVKGLPLTYCRDLQEDKEIVFQAFDVTSACTEMAALLCAGIRFNEERMAAYAGDWALMATDIADALARQGVPFREAHKIVGDLVKACLARGTAGGVSPSSLSAEELAAISPLLTPELVSRLNAQHSVSGREYPMATGPMSVAGQLEKARGILSPQV